MKIGTKEFDNNNLYIMGILNLTPDSFYDGGRLYTDDKLDMDKVLYAVKHMVDNDVAIIDIGGESTRPGFTHLTVEEELDRIMKPMERIKAEFDVPISIDTYKGATAKEVIKAGADLINDIGFLPDEMAEAIKGENVAYCLMHNREVKTRPEASLHTMTMDDLNNEIANKLLLLEEYGFGPDNVMIDPGIGFGKSNEDDLMILNDLDAMKCHNYPILIAASNKSCLNYVDPSDKSDRLEGTLAITAQSFYHGMNFVRVHDVRSNARLIKMLRRMNINS